MTWWFLQNSVNHFQIMFKYNIINKSSFTTLNIYIFISIYR
jgi:hypothetical protein